MARGLGFIKEAFSVKYIGLGLFWAWCYCLWFVPKIKTSGGNLAASENLLWLVCLFFAAVLHFLVPTFLGKQRRLSSYRWVRISSPLIMTIGSVLLEAADILSLPEYVCFFIAALLGIFSAMLWNLWGEFYATVKERMINSIAPTFGIILIASLAISTFFPILLANAFVALLPLFSGLCYLQAKKLQDTCRFPLLLPKASQHIGWVTIIKVCFIAFFACGACTFLWALLPAYDFEIGYQLMTVGVGGGALFILVLSVFIFAFPERFSITKFFPGLIIITIVSFLLYLFSTDFKLVVYLLSMGASVLFDVFLVIHFGIFTSKGYTRPSVSFGYSEGFICAGMFIGSIAGDLAISTPFSPTTISAICFAIVFLLILMIVPLIRQEYTVELLVTSSSEPSEIEKNCKEIGEEFGLSARELEVLILLATGYSTDNIAQKLVLSSHTVQTHIKNIYSKMQIHKRSELIDYVNRNRLDPT